MTDYTRSIALPVDPALRAQLFAQYGVEDNGQDILLVPMTQDQINARQAEEADFEASRSIPDPLVAITAAVKSLPVAKRTEPVWGAFIGQCLLAIQHGDNEALAYLINNFQTGDADYQAIIAQAKQLFGLA